MFCSKCGEKLENGANFCPHCGQAVTSVNNTTPFPQIDAPITATSDNSSNCPTEPIQITEPHAMEEALSLTSTKIPAGKILLNYFTSFLLLFMMCCPFLQQFFSGTFLGDGALAAVSAASPFFILLSSVGLLFGIGASSAISRALGKGNTERIRPISAFSVWGSFVLTLLLSALLFFTLRPIGRVLGIPVDIFDMYASYGIFLCFTAPLAAISNCIACLLMATGKSLRAIVGQVGIVIIFPVLSYLLTYKIIRGGVVELGLALCISYGFETIYYLVAVITSKTALSIRFSNSVWKSGVIRDVLKSGAPTLLTFVAFSVLGISCVALISNYGSTILASFGVPSTISVFTAISEITVGIGMIPILGYHFGAKDQKAFWKKMAFASILLIGVSCVMSLSHNLFASRDFILNFTHSQEVLEYTFNHINMLPAAGLIFGLMCLLGSAIQTTDKGWSALVPYFLYTILVFSTVLPNLESMEVITIPHLWEIFIAIITAVICVWTLSGKQNVEFLPLFHKAKNRSGLQMSSPKKKKILAGCAGLLIVAILAFVLTRTSSQKLVGSWVKEEYDSWGSMPSSIRIYSDGTYRGQSVGFTYWEGTYEVKGNAVTFDVMGDADKRYYWKVEENKLTFFKDDGIYGEYIRSLQ